MVTLRSLSNTNACSRILLEGKRSIIRPKHQKVFYMNPGCVQKFYDSENNQVLEISMLGRATRGARFAIRLGDEKQQKWTFLYSEFLRADVGNKLFEVQLTSPQNLATAAFYCQILPSLREACLVNFAEEMLAKDMRIPEPDQMPESIIKELERLKSYLYNGSLPSDQTFLSKKTKIVDI